MNASRNRVFKLAPSGDPYGVSCDGNGASVGLVDPKIQALLNLVFANYPGAQLDLAEKAAKYGKPL